MKPRNVETGAPDRANRRQPRRAAGASAPDRANRQRSESAAALIVASRGSGGGLDFAELLCAVLRQNPPPVITSAEALTVSVSPDDPGRGLRARWIDASGGGLSCRPIAEFREGFDDHGRILRAAETERNPDRGNPPFRVSQVSTYTPDRRNPRETRRNCFRLDPTSADVILRASGASRPRSWQPVAYTAT